MRSVAAMELVLARFAGKRRAAAMMGDLLEQREQKGEWWFWRSFVGVLLAVAWRPLVGLVGAFYVTNWALNGMMSRQIGMWQTPDLETITFLGMVAWFVVVYAGVRYGVRDGLVQLAAALAAVSTGVMFFLRYAAAPWIGLILALCLLIASCIPSGRRRAAAVFLVTGAVFIAGYYGAALLDMVYQQQILHLRMIGSRELEEHPSIGAVFVGAMLLGQIVTAYICGWMHRQLIQRRSKEIATDG